MQPLQEPDRDILDWQLDELIDHIDVNIVADKLTLVFFSKHHVMQRVEALDAEAFRVNNGQLRDD